ADAAQAVDVVDTGLTVIALVREARSATVDVGFRAIRDAITARGNGARAGGADAAQAIGGRGAILPGGASRAAPSAIDVGLGTVPLSVITGRRNARRPWTAVLALTVRRRVAMLTDATRGTIGATAVRVGFLSVLQVVIACRRLTNKPFAHTAGAIESGQAG